MLRIAFDIGGVLSRYPSVFRQLIQAWQLANLHNLLHGRDELLEVHIISDMHDHAKMMKMLHDNDFIIAGDRVHSADYKTHGEACKAVLCHELGIDVLLDRPTP